MSVGPETPIGRVLSKLQGVKRSEGGWVARCPAHGDKHQSLGIDISEGKVLLRCFADCSVDAIVAAMGLKMGDLFTTPLEQREPKPGKHSLTLAELCSHKKLPIEFLRSLGWRDSANGYGAVVEIPYVQRDGTTHRVRLRVALSAKDRFRWAKGEGMIAYDPDRGVKAVEQGYVVIVEGETDVATLLFVNVPALGIPGATATHTLTAEHLAGLKCAFVLQETDAAGEAFVAGIKERVGELGVELPVHVLKMPGAAKDPSALFVRNPDAFEALLHTALVEAAKPAPGLLDDTWKTLGEWGSLDREPPARRWLLDRPDEETNGARHVGVLPLGKVGMLIAAGGVGKTMALIQFGLAVATGRKWLDYFGVVNEGRVLLALGEEDEEEIWRRVYQAALAMRLTDAQVEKARRNIVALPLAGTVVNLIKSEDGETAETAIMSALKKRLNDGPDWRALVFDPLSRFAGFDSEKDNAAATTFISVMESFTKAPGRPTVLIAHHTNKASRQEGAERGNAANARGASALVDGVRWAASLDPLTDGTVSFKVTKTNYSMGFDPVVLTRDSDHGGFLRVQSQAEATAVMDRAHERKTKALQTLRDLVIRTISERPGLKSGNDLFDIIRGNRPALFAVLRELKMEGFVTATRDGFKLSERSGLND